MEPTRTAWLLTGVAALLLLAALATRLSGRFGVPSLLFFLALGMVARLQPFVPVPPPDYLLSFRLGTAALVLILFDGGLNTPARAARMVALPASVLATAGVVGTSLIVGGLARLSGLSWPLSVLLGAIVSSTDAAAVIAALRASHSRLRERVGLTLELESGLNDPMALFLTIVATEAVLGEATIGLSTLTLLGRQLLLGVLAGAATGLGGRWLLRRAGLSSAGLYPVLTVALAFGSFGLATIVDGSGFLAVYLAALLLGRRRIPYRASILRVHDALAWLSQITMFLVLGLSVLPAELTDNLGRGTILALGLALIARPAAVLLCLLPFRFEWQERLFIAAAGLRGAVPIILATYPLLRGVTGAHALFDLVFVMVVVGTVVPGSLLGALSRALDLRRARPPPPPAGLEMNTAAEFDGEFVSYFIAPASAAAGARVSELPLPDGCLLTLLVRGRELLTPRGSTEILAGDHVLVFTREADRAFADLVFGQAEE